MSERSFSASPDETALAKFMGDLETAADAAAQSAVLLQYSSRHPHLAEEMRELMEMGRRVREAPRPGPAEAPQLKQGQRLGAFCIVRCIAVGGMGEIYEAEQVGLPRHVAVKVIRHGRVTPAARDRFHREQHALARLHQTNIVPIFAAGEEENLQYFAMPYIDGVTLGRVVAAAGSWPRPAPLPSLAKLVEHLLAEPALDDERAAPAPVRRSGEYFRSVARAIAQAADAVHHAHHLGIIHRDLKPSNLMIDRGGQCWIIDFGLAGLEHDERDASDTLPTAAAREALSLGPLGTPAYMAPEQHRGEAEVRSDVWSLGATLFELLTLRRAFDGPSTGAIRDLVLNQEPDVTGGAGGVPGDLLAICRKALSKDPSRRYATAAALADDLRRWLAQRPVTARPDRLIRPAWLWTVRNWPWAGPVALALATAIALIWSRVQWRADQLRADATLAQTQAEDEKRRAADAEARERQQQLKVQLLELRRLRMARHQMGWRGEALNLAARIAAISPSEVQPEAAGCLSGLDARFSKRWLETGQELGGWSKLSSGAVAYTADGRLYAGGWDESVAFIWDGRREIRSNRTGRGPVGFAGAVPIRVLAPTDQRRTFQVLRGIGAEETVEAEWPVPEGLTVPADEVVLSADGVFVAAPLRPAEAGTRGTASVRVWDIAGGKSVRVLDTSAEHVALTADGRFLAAGEGNRVDVYDVAAGTRVAAVPPGWSEVRCLAFGHSPRSTAGQPESAWMLAIGYSGNAVRVIDLATRSLISQCGPFGAGGGNEDPAAMVFDPTGMLLAVVGRGPPQLFDVFTGMHVLELKPDRNILTGVAFSHDGLRIAASSILAHGSPGGVDECALEPGRGMIDLRGLATAPRHIRFSPDGRFVAAVGYDWQIGLWTLPEGRLRALWRGPHGAFSDSIAVRFSPDGTRFVAAAGREAMLWDTATARLEWAKTLPPGLQDCVAFHASGALLLARFELEDGSGYPDSEHPPARHPRVIRVRDLHAANHLPPLREVRDLARHVLGIQIADDGDHVGAHGVTVDREGRLIVFETRGFAPVWTVRALPGSSAVKPPDFVTFPGRLNCDGVLYDLRTHQPVAAGPADGVELSADLGNARVAQGYSVYEEARRNPTTRRMLFRAATSGHVRDVVLDPERRRFVWAGVGNFTFGDLDAVRRELTALGLGW